MKRDRLSFVAGFMPPLCMAFMLIFEHIVNREIIGRTEYIVASAEILPFLTPFLLITFLGKAMGEEKAQQPAKKVGMRGIPFALNMSMAAALASFLLNSLVSLLFGASPATQLRYSDSLSGILTAIIIVVVLPSVFEELFFRKGLLGAFSRHGTMSAIFVSALTFALVHGNPRNLIGPFASGLIYGYMAYAFGSIWPAVLAHMVNNTFHLAVGYFAKAYEPLGIWPYFLLISAVALGIFLYFAMRNLEKLIEGGRVPRMKAGGLKGLATSLLFTPGLWLMMLMYIIKVVYL